MPTYKVFRDIHTVLTLDVTADSEEEAEEIAGTYADNDFVFQFQTVGIDTAEEIDNA
jgi:hypothetical protein